MASRTPFLLAALLNLLVAGLVLVGLAFPIPRAQPDAAPNTTRESTPASVTEEGEQPDTAADVAAALTTLDSLEVKGRAPMTGYEREEFGQAWSDDVTVEFGHNGCDTRNDILRRDLDNLVIKDGTHDCVALSGTLQDPYSGQAIEFQRGAETSDAVQIDHVVALADAWQKGAGDAATWLPPNKAFRCEYAQRIVEVKAAYGVWVTDAEKQTLRGLLQAC